MGSGGEVEGTSASPAVPQECIRALVVMAFESQMTNSEFEAAFDAAERIGVDVEVGA